MEKIKVIIERTSDGFYTAIPEHDYEIGFYGSGKTVEDAMKDLKQSHAEAKVFLPGLPDFEYSIIYDVASFLQLFSKKMSLAGLLAITGINRKQLSHYVTGHSRPSAATVRKIEKGIAEFSKELANIILLN